MRKSGIHDTTPAPENFIPELASSGAIMNEGKRREHEWLAGEVAFSARFSDADRIRILRDLLRTADAIRKTKSAEEIRREEEVRRQLEDLPARERYAAAFEKQT
jgi:hypothetical protein